MSDARLEALEAIRGALGTLDEVPDETPPDPYVADAKAFAIQAGVCVEKSLAGKGIEIPPDPNRPEVLPMPEMPAAEPEETSRDRDKAS